MQLLHVLDLLDTEPEDEFDELVQLAAEICNTPMSLVTLIDSERQWFKAKIGVELTETHRDHAFCSRAIEQPDLFMVKDASRDPRFHDNPLVTGDPGIRFYAGIPLQSADTIAYGTLCVIDTVPRDLTAGQQNALRILARQVQARIELRAQQKALAQANVKLERLANTDALTGLYNRRAFDERIAAQFAVAERNERPLSVLLMDLDYFKRRNDQFGHTAGDEALRALGLILKETARAGDVAARIGGEEFAVLLPETDGCQAKSFAERIQASLAELSLTSGPLTASIGIASKDRFKRTWDRLLVCADDAMYEAKRAGRNRIISHQEYIDRLLLSTQ